MEQVEEFDYLIVGTAITQSVLAAALAQKGQRVIHIDKNAHYGGDMGTLSLEDYQDKFKQENQGTSDFIICYAETLQNLRDYFLCSSTQDVNDSKRSITKRFRVELTPKTFPSSSLALRSLLASNTHRYMNFYNVDPISTLSTRLEESMPTNKSEIFKSKLLSFQEKRKLMKFIQFCTEKAFSAENKYISSNINEDTSQLKAGRSLLRPQNLPQIIEIDPTLYETAAVSVLKNNFALSENLINSVFFLTLPVISKLEMEKLSFRNFLEGIKTFVLSSGSFSASSSFIINEFGSVDIVESFCRYAALRGTVYKLRTKIKGIGKESNGYSLASLSDGTFVRVKQIIQTGKEAVLQRGNKSLVCIKVMLYCKEVKGEEDNKKLHVIFPDDPDLKNEFVVYIWKLGSDVCLSNKTTNFWNISTFFWVDITGEETIVLEFGDKLMKKLQNVFSLEKLWGSTCYRRVTEINSEDNPSAIRVNWKFDMDYNIDSQFAEAQRIFNIFHEGEMFSTES
eukprot:maker-scaffold_12-snap-gene-8.17-mRNA-1 protein AED:0.00 eAED:0.00 QI:52/1/1/1/1/1/2/371/508